MHTQAKWKSKASSSQFLFVMQTASFFIIMIMIRELAVSDAGIEKVLLQHMCPLERRGKKKKSTDRTVERIPEIQYWRHTHDNSCQKRVLIRLSCC